MDRVYHCSRRVLVWLDFEDGRPAFDVRESLLKSVLTTADNTVDQRVSLGPMETQQVAGLASLAWFSRVWTFQGIRLAKLALVLCEGRTMEWTYFRKAIALLCQEIRHSGSEFGRKMGLYVG